MIIWNHFPTEFLPFLPDTMIRINLVYILPVVCYIFKAFVTNYYSSIAFFYAQYIFETNKDV